ncbi:unnamed protein product [Phytomonas sp. Hart1]|nr:unnamed protein product [Phytomonas sp. Hart1]|eukprot:CCW68899.1 unnamed protein product [Phytomonas sp. isolate Hart1]
MVNYNRLSFIVEYFDPHASLTRTYQLLYHLDDNTIEMHDLKLQRLFLKRCAYPSLTTNELFIGAIVYIFSRPLKVIDYGDEATRKQLGANSETVMIIISENSFFNSGNIVSSLTDSKLRIMNIRMLDLPQYLATRSNTTQRVILAVLTASQALEKTKKVCKEYPQDVSIVEDDELFASLEGLMRGPGPTTACLANCAVCVIKPHAITSGHQGYILQRLYDEAFTISALGMYMLTRADSEDFLEVYNGVMPEYNKMVEQLSSGPVWAIEVRAENAVAALRAVCGPHDPDMGHSLFPHTIRSQYGTNRICNAVHCTDLEEDGPLESEFFFSLLQNKQ